MRDELAEMTAKGGVCMITFVPGFVSRAYAGATHGWNEDDCAKLVVPTRCAY